MKKNEFKIFALLIALLSGINGIAQMPYVDTVWVEETPVVGVGNYFHTSSIISNGKLVVTGNILNGNGDTDVLTIMFDTNGDTLWSSTFAGNFTGGGDDYGVELLTVASGDIAVCAAVKTNAGGYDYALLWYDGATGSLDWSYIWDGNSGTDIPSCMRRETNNDIYIGGASEATNGFSDFGIIRISSTGSFMWETFYDNNDLHDGVNALGTISSYLVAVGASASGIGDWDMVAFRINKSTGAITGTPTITNIAGATIVEAYALTTDSLNSVYFTGYAQVGGDKDIQTIKLDSSLALKWIADYEGTLDDVGKDISVDGDGNVFVTGYAEESAGRFKSILIKYDDNGDTLATTFFGNTLTMLGAKGEKMVIDSIGNILLTGTTEDSDSIRQMFFNKYNNEGELLLSTEYSSYGIDDVAYDISTEGNNVYITGLSSSLSGPRMTVLNYELLQDVDFRYFYLGGQKVHWSQQPGMYSFSLIDSSFMSGLIDSTIVIDVEYTYDGNHYVFFSSSATELQVDSIINIIESDMLFDKEYMVAVMTNNNGQPFSEQLYAGLDNFVEVVFDDPEIDSLDVLLFADDYNMTLFHYPTNIVGGVYIFQVPRDSNRSISMELAAQIWENDSAIVERVMPSLRLFRPHDPDDLLYEGLWWAENDGSWTCNGESWVNDSDMDMDKAWNIDDEFAFGESWSGNGVTVGVIDFHGYEYDHPDLVSVYQTGYILPGSGTSGGLTFNATTMFTTDAAHGQNVAGLIGANGENGEGVIGAAYNSSIIPCVLLSGTTAAVNSGIQILTDPSKKVSIINMSFGFSLTVMPFIEYTTLYTTCQNAYTQGRPDFSNPSITHGIILVASAGTSHVESTSVQYNAPACIDAYVLSVGATTPDDKRKALGDSYNPAWASPYFPGLDVSAPGICIISTDFQGSLGNNTAGDYYYFAGTSAAAPLASGVAALILEKNQELDALEVYNIMRWSCEKVGGYTYTMGGAPEGKCTELGHGRLNAYNAISDTPLLQTPEGSLPFNVFYNNPAGDLLQLSVIGIDNYTVTIVNVSGAICYEQTVNQQQYSEINVGNLAEGLYFITITDINLQLTSTTKLVIQ